MPRALPEWIGSSPETPAPTRVRARIIVAQGGICACGCGVKLGSTGERIEFDHKQALILGGENRESNLRALRRPCHRLKTNGDVSQKAVEARKRNKHLGIAATKSRLPGGKNDKWKRTLDGRTVLRGQ